MLAAGSELLPDRWFQVTLLDAYCGFITFYVWVCYKERSTAAKSIWLVAIMFLGNIAMSAYMLLQLTRLAPDADWKDLLMREEPAQGAD